VVTRAAAGSPAARACLAGVKLAYVDRALMSLADSRAVFMHCLPAHRGREVTAEVIDGPQSVVFDQAANRVPTEQALVRTLLHG